MKERGPTCRSVKFVAECAIIKMICLRIEKGFDDPGYLVVFDCEDIIDVERHT